ncbi:hypothetical protein [Pseudoflavonifractor sp. An85]|uniref:hypothetical protein n=1 Tax=Pseudoflavonifractor sp. An85 TaxID=1965661 RepID=UPI000B3678F1|nr:hypothetical protein [Pseudoflavonifractor sp. An85]OUN24266.1 hypothetical protein B5G37_08200 [Pseudoflavonifractor sp. An85]
MPVSNYLNNNLDLIDQYQKLYSTGINIDSVIEKFRTEEIITHHGLDYGKFRVFIDSCLLLLNREKLNTYYRNGYSFKEFLIKASQDIRLRDYLEFIKQDPFTCDISDTCIYYSLANEKKKPWDQIMTIRNALAHMQYGHFSAQENGTIVFFMLYNRDHGISKDFGIVLEPLLHELVYGFFNNYSSGLLFKTTFFSKYSFQSGRKSLWSYYFYEITPKISAAMPYDGYSCTVTRELAQIWPDGRKLLGFLQENHDKITIKESKLNSLIKIRHYKKLAKNMHLTTKLEYIYGLKTFLDFQGELSNFLVHIGQLNDVLYQYCTKSDSTNVDPHECQEYKKWLEQAIYELQEDHNSTLSFKLGFIYLYTMNFILRTEDDDYIKLNYQALDVSKFKYQMENWTRYRDRENAQSDCLLQNYIVERMRNSLMHGLIDVLLNSKGNIEFVFRDKYNKRDEQISIQMEDLEEFLSQKCLYENSPAS